MMPDQTQGNRMSIDKKTARRVAHLARIEVADDQLDKLAAELSNILGFMEQLNEVDVEGVEAMTSVTPMALKRREDVVTDGGYQDKILANAPDAREGFFAVPKVVE
jgi:aspartyl/glutamyl-tRNA(Asn/Gln) amidotransferase subunit C (EC 6.3.5.-)